MVSHISQFWRSPAGLVATWFGIGLFPGAPGTWASLVALPFAYGLLSAGGLWALTTAAILVFFAGLWASSEAIKALGTVDPHQVVVDEVAGQWLALIPAGLDLRFWPIAFICFRLADIVKPWPVSVAEERLKGALGIMGDDIVAGAYASIATWAVVQWFNY